MEKPFVNSWTEFGELEYVCVGIANGEIYWEAEPFYKSDFKDWDEYDDFITYPFGPRPQQRIRKAKKELDNFRELLEAEQVTVASVVEFENDIKQEMQRKRSFVDPPANVVEDKRVKKPTVKTCRPPDERVDYNISTPWFTNNSQVGFACPRDMVITLGNTVLECAPSYRSRFFESFFYRPLIWEHYETDKRIHWKAAPKPTCDLSMLHYIYEDNRDASIKKSGTALNEKEMAFDAADMMRIGKDVFYKRSASANYKGLEWLRREFPDLRFHAMHFKRDTTPHIDVNLIPLRAPSSGSDGIVLLNRNHPPLLSEIALFKDNNWDVLFGPLPATTKVSPVALCSPSLNLNLLSLNPKCVIIEECEVPLYHFLEDLGFDVITAPLRTLNEFGGGPHCVTWDIRRNDECKDYFLNQNYEEECCIKLNDANNWTWLESANSITSSKLLK